MSTSMSSKICSPAINHMCLEMPVKWCLLSDDMGRCIIEGSCDSMCLSTALRSSTGSISGDRILVIAAST